jgi:UDP-glucose 4-epimerase
MNWKNKNVLVTGGASFIGSHLVDRLIELRSNVRVADNLSSGKLENLSQSIDEIEFIKGNLEDSDFAQKVMKDIDVVFHLAAEHGGRGYIDKHPAECVTNFILDGMVFKKAFKAGVDRICFASSACVYPTYLQEEKNVVYLSEDMANPFVPGKANADLEYGWAKLMGEMTLKAYYKEYGLKCSSCRIFTAYGPRENETHSVIALIAKAFIEQDPYEIWGTGQQDRNFTYVSDIVNGLIHACAKIENGTPVNIGTHKHIKIKDIGEKIFDIIGWKPNEIFFDTSKPIGVFSRAADITNTKKLLQWEPKVSIEEGIRKTVDWYFSTKDREEIRSNFQKLIWER